MNKGHKVFQQFQNNNHDEEWLLNVVPSSPIIATLMLEALSSSEMSVLTRATHGVTCQKTPFFIVTAVKNLRSYNNDNYTSNNSYDKIARITTLLAISSHVQN
jgi:hypothetical protein